MLSFSTLMLGGIDCMTSQGAGTTVLCQSAIRFSQFYLSKAVFVYKVCCPLFMPRPCFIPSSLSTFYTDHFRIILVILVILAIQAITIFLEITIMLYQCCQSFAKSLLKYLQENYLLYELQSASILVIPLKPYLSESRTKF